MVFGEGKTNILKVFGGYMLKIFYNNILNALNEIHFVQLLVERVFHY